MQRVIDYLFRMTMLGYIRSLDHEGNTLNMWYENVSDHFGTFDVSYQMSSIFVYLHKSTEFDRLKSKAASDINAHCRPLECSLKAS